jgi:hypothetical protein
MRIRGLVIYISCLRGPESGYEAEKQKLIDEGSCKSGLEATATGKGASRHPHLQALTKQAVGTRGVVGSDKYHFNVQAAVRASHLSLVEFELATALPKPANGERHVFLTKIIPQHLCRHLRAVMNETLGPGASGNAMATYKLKS